MRVLYVLPSEGFGGAERQGVLAMQTLPEEGIEVIPIVGPGYPIVKAMEAAGVFNFLFCTEFPSSMEGPGAWIDRLHLDIKLFKSWRKTCAVVSDEAIRLQVDAIYASRAFGWAVAAVVGRRVGIKTIWRAGSRAVKPAHVALLSLLGKTCSPSGLVCNCGAVQTSIAPFLRCKSFIVHNGVDLARFDPQRARPRLRGEFGLSDTPVIGIAARPAPEKGFDILFKVLKTVLTEVSNVRVLIAGEYAWKSEYETLMRKHGLSDMVQFLGHIDDMENFYKSCDLILLTSKKVSIEGLPNALLEAMAMATPVVATNVGGVSEAITNGQDGYLFDPDNIKGIAKKVISLILDARQRQEIGEAGRLRIESEFSEQKMSSKLAEVFRFVMRESDGKVEGATALNHQKGEIL